MANETGSKQEFSMCFSSTFTQDRDPVTHFTATPSEQRPPAQPALTAQMQHTQVFHGIRASLQSPRLLPHTPYLCPCLILLPCLGPFQDETHGGVESRDMAFLLMLLSQSIRS